MHEAGLVGQALDQALDGAFDGGAVGPGGLVLEVLDPVGLSVESTLLHLEVVLAEHGLTDVPVSVHVTPVRCAGCGESGVPAAGDLFCASCGWPLPRREGPPLRIRPLAGAAGSPDR